MVDLIAERYEVLEKIGSGALGEVFRVKDRLSGAVQALKLLKPQTGGAAGEGRFEREFEAISRIEHPNIIKVHDYGMHGNQPYFSMELLTGCVLKTYVADNRPEKASDGFDAYAAKIAYLFHQVADALDTVHAEGVVHRDLKPDNIFVKPGKFPRAKLLDFGHARQDDQKNLTQTGTVLGTAWYIPPEQAMARPIGPAADLYAMGCVMFEAIAGRPPFHGGNVVEVLMAHIQQAIPDLRETEPRAPAVLVELCGHLMQKQPEMRPATAGEVAARLSGF